MSVTRQTAAPANAPPAIGLSPRTQDLWLAALNYRRLADALAAEARKAAP